MQNQQQLYYHHAVELTTTSNTERCSSCVNRQKINDIRWPPSRKRKLRRQHFPTARVSLLLLLLVLLSPSHNGHYYFLFCYAQPAGEDSSYESYDYSRGPVCELKDPDYGWQTIDYYELLDLPNDVNTTSSIRKAYRKQAREWHPDKRREANETVPIEEINARFSRISEAHEVLSDPDKRNKYDKWLAYCDNNSNNQAPEEEPDDVQTNQETFVDPMTGQTILRVWQRELYYNHDYYRIMYQDFMMSSRGSYEPIFPEPIVFEQGSFQDKQQQQQQQQQHNEHHHQQEHQYNRQQHGYDHDHDNHHQFFYENNQRHHNHHYEPLRNHDDEMMDLTGDTLWPGEYILEKPRDFQEYQYYMQQNDNIFFHLSSKNGRYSTGIVNCELVIMKKSSRTSSQQYDDDDEDPILWRSDNHRPAYWGNEKCVVKLHGPHLVLELDNRILWASDLLNDLQESDDEFVWNNYNNHQRYIARLDNDGSLAIYFRKDDDQSRRNRDRSRRKQRHHYYDDSDNNDDLFSLSVVERFAQRIFSPSEICVFSTSEGGCNRLRRKIIHIVRDVLYIFRIVEKKWDQFDFDSIPSYFDDLFSVNEYDDHDIIDQIIIVLRKEGRKLVKASKKLWVQLYHHSYDDIIDQVTILLRKKGRKLSKASKKLWIQLRTKLVHLKSTIQQQQQRRQQQQWE